MTRATYMRNILTAVIVMYCMVPLLAFAEGEATETTPPAETTPAETTDPTDKPVSEPYQFKNEGIFGCSQVAGAAMSAGTLSAIGGVYVPVNDAAVTLNTGVLIYKECVLRPLTDRLREGATAGLFKKGVTGIQTGREGDPLYSVNPAREDTDIDLKERVRIFTDGTTDSIDPKFRSAVVTAVARAIRQEAYAPEQDLVCPFKGSASEDVWGAILSLQYPQCNALGTSNILYDKASARGSSARAYNQEQRWIGRGVYAVTDNPDDPLRQNILTPASIVQESFQQLLNSPLTQLQSANDIGQMIGALFSGATTQIITDNKGLAGLTRSIGSQPSYLDQVAKESSQGIVGAAVNAALTILNAARQNEASYLASMNAIASSRTQTIARLRSAENQCWNLVIANPGGPHVCATPLAANNTCKAVVECTTDSTTGEQTCPTAPTLQVATSTAFSQGVIDSQIRPLADVSVANVEASKKALKLIDQLIGGVTNTSSLNAQRISLQQLDSLVAQKALHNQYDAIRAAEQLKDVQTAMANLIEDTVKAWADSTDPTVGWCNVNNPSVIQGWIDRWKK